VTLWLHQVGLPVTLNPLDEANQLVLQSSVGMVWPNAPDPIADQALQHYLKQLTGSGLNQAEQGIWLQSGATLLASHQGTTAFPAASLTKVVITLAALATWPPDQRFTTIVKTTGTLQNRELRGDLVVQGGGDPLFGWEAANHLGQQLNQLGIIRVAGDLVIEPGFVMNFQVEPTAAGERLKQALDSSTGSEIGLSPAAKSPLGPPRPQVAIAGKVRATTTPTALDATERLRLPSLPLGQLLRKMNVHSNNVMAQMLADALGGHAAAINQAATAAGIDRQEIQLVNGSGLGVENRLSARAVCALFRAIDRLAQRHNLTLGDLFPSAGFDRGTLEDRHVPATSVVKTGTLSTVSALAGVLPTRDRGLVYFTIINRGTDISDLRNQQDNFLHRLQQQWGQPLTPPSMLMPAASIKPEGDIGEFSEP
jgi:serine-type D-Ala-D-Ala carboxypeptidase/endopeptidase (penicillin-binding protein 4)